MIIKAILGHHIKEDGTAQVKIYIYSGGRKDLIPTDFYIKPAEWDSGKVKKMRPNADYINSQINIKIVDLEKTWLLDRNIGVSNLKKRKPIKDKTLFEFLESYIKGMKDGSIVIEGKNAVNKGQRYSKYSWPPYVSLQKILVEFNPALNWPDITKEFFNDFIVFLRKKEYADNYVTKNIKCLCTIMTRGIKHHKNTDYLKFSVSYSDSDTIALDESEIKLIIECKPPRHLIEERDRFYLSYNFFLRFGDSIKIEQKDIFEKNKKHFVKIMANKTKNIVIIPLLAHTLTLLKKYKFNLPDITNQESNWKIKEIGKIAKVDTPYTQITTRDGKIEKITAPKYHFITTHTARRSMATNLYLSMKEHKNVDLKAIALMGGWKSVAQLEKYLKLDKLDNAIAISEHPFFN